MDRSTPDEGWSDAGDGAYPPAPLPAHERQWRHPSEMGQHAWVITEPPIAIGRGLLMVTGTIGCMLGLAILWMMLPVGGNGAPVAEPVVTRSVDTVPRRTTATLTADVSTVAAASAGSQTDTGDDAADVADPALGPSTGTDGTPGAPSVAPSTSVGSAGSTATDDDPSATAPAGSGSTPTLPAEAVPSNTVLLRPDQPTDQRAIAVIVGDSPMMITTSRAVGSGDGQLDVRLDSGATATATLVSTSGALAYLAPTAGAEGSDDAAPTTLGFTSAAPAVMGDTLFVLGDDAFSFVFDGGNRLVDRHDELVEGTPVVDRAGDLVALCTHDAQGVAIVPVVAEGASPGAAPASAVTTTTAASPTTTAAAATTATSTTAAAPTITDPATGTGTANGASGTGASTSTTSTTNSTTTSAPSGLSAGSAWVGIRLTAVDSNGHSWITVTAVAAGSPAADAGLQIGQRIVSIDGRYLDSIDATTSAIQAHRPGDGVVLGLLPPATANEPTVQPVTKVTVVLGVHEPSV